MDQRLLEYGLTQVRRGGGMAGGADGSTAFFGDLYRFSLVAPYRLTVQVIGTALDTTQHAASTTRAAAVAGLSSLWSAVLPGLEPVMSHASMVLLLAFVVLLWLVYSPPWWAVHLLARRFAGKVLFKFPVQRLPSWPLRRTRRRAPKFVALTLDDGPCPYNSLEVMDVLRAHGARATHFIIGSHVEQCDRVGAGVGRVQFGRILLRQMLVDGHELGNHTWCAAGREGRFLLEARVVTRDLRRGHQGGSASAAHVQQSPPWHL